jgi:hypothetical protein
MVGFDVFRDPAEPRPDSTVGRGIEDFCRARGVNFEAIQRNRFRILPPLTIERAQVDRFVAVLDEAVLALAEGRVAPEPPRNRWSLAFQERATRARGVKAAVKWALTHSPQEWVGRVRGLRPRG